MAAATQAAQTATQEDENLNLKNSESLASSILSLKPSSSISNNLENLYLNNNDQQPQSDLNESNNLIPKLITEIADDLKQSDLENNNNSTAINNNLLPNNLSSNSLSVKSLEKSHSRSPSPNRLRSKSPNLKNEIPDHGVRLVHGFHLTEICENAVGNELMSKLVNDWRSLSIDELNRLTPNIRFKYGYEYTSIIIEPGSYLRYLMAKFHSNKGQTLKRTISFRSINDFEFLHRNFHVVFNCTGLGARQLMSDHQMVPVRGQTVSVHAPWIKNFYTFDTNYIYPRYDGKLTIRIL